jgi:hypothetical protein
LSARPRKHSLQRHGGFENARQQGRETSSVGRKAKNEVIDKVCREWGQIRRQLVGIDDPKLAKDYIGALRSTLGQRRDLHSGSKSNKLDIQWPEVYEGDAKLVNDAFHRMRPYLRVVMEIHFCANAEAQRKADFLCVSLAVYWREVNEVRSFVEGWLACCDTAA